MRYIPLFIIVIILNNLNEVSAQQIFSNPTLAFSPILSNRIYNGKLESFKPGYNTTLKIYTRASDKTQVTMGIGYSNIGFTEISNNGQDKIHSLSNYNFLYFTYGIKYKIKESFLLIESGIGINTYYRKNVRRRDTDNTYKILKGKKYLNQNNKELFVPINLTFGKKFNFGTDSLNIGLKAFFTLSKTPEKQNIIIISSDYVPEKYNLFGFGLFLEYEL